MKTVTIRKIEIGCGKPKICVPLVSTTIESLLTKIQTIKQYPIDMVEWRMDYMPTIFELEKTKEIVQVLRDALGNMPLLCTFRTIQEGGNLDCTKEQYNSLYQVILSSRCADLIDIEVFYEETITNTLLTLAKQKQVVTILSNHDFEQTPSKAEILSRLGKMQELGADIAKIAVMPTTVQDVLTLLDATTTFHKDSAIPIVTMSMGSLGRISRISGETFGSSITFGNINEGSAPGQIQVSDLHKILEIVHLP